MLSVMLRCLTAVMVGILLIIYKSAVMPFIVRLIGVAFLLPGLIAVGLRLFAVKNGNSRPANDVFSDIERKFGFDGV